MKARSHRAAAVVAEAGVGPGDAVALMCFNTPEFADALLGAWRLSAVVVPVNHKLQAPGLEYILRHSDAKVLVFDASPIGWPNSRYHARSTSSSDCPERQPAKSRSICCNSRASQATPFRRMAPNTGKTSP